ncbi:MAG TPA: hypothetical protein VGD80_13225 [Kofleriaceae bacterium]
MKQPTSKLNAVPRCREVELRELDRIRGGTVVVSDPGPGDGKGPKIAGDPPSAP